MAENRPLPLGGPKQRALLAVLLLRGNEVVSRAALVDALWGADAPRSAVQSLQVYVHGLRQALGAERIETHGSSYRLPVADEELDLLRFERLLESARRALAAGHAADAADDLRAALGLWRGSPLADIAGEHVAETEAPRLADRRLQAAELLNEAELALGKHAELVGALEGLIAEEPFRERLRAQHVLALYRAGRQKEALEAHRAARDTFVAELGVDPGAELQELERKILRQDPSLAAPEAPGPALVKLPVPPTTLIGRRLEIAAVTALLRSEGVRLLTLTGPGGTGKTRLALAVAAELGSQLRDGAVFVDLAPLHDAELLAPTIAHALEISEGGSAEQSLQEYLRERRLLLVLDNLEQLVPETQLVGRLLAASPQLLVLATSRTPLRLAAEHEYPVPPLETPNTRGRAAFEDLAANDAVRLFAARARAVNPGFELDEEAARAVGRICERLDGLPLAIELAAARSKLFSPETLGSRLDRRLELLTGGPLDMPARQQTLRATLEWSYELLDEAERSVFARLSVFAGGWTLAAAEAVCGEGLDVVGVLARLVDDNLVRRLERAHEPRFVLLETIGEYAREQLTAADELEAVSRGHAEYLLSVATAAAPQLLTGGPEAYTRLDDDYENLRVALRWFAAEGDIVSELRLFDAIWNYISVRGYLSEGRALLESMVERGSEAPTDTRAHALILCGTFAFRQGDYARSKQVTEEALALFRELGDVGQISRCIGTLGNIAVGDGELDQAVELYEEAAALARETENRSRLAVILANLGSIAGQRDDAEASARYASEAVALQRDLEEMDALSVSLHNLGRAELALGNVDAAAAALDESLTLARQLGYREVIAYGLSGLAELALLEEQSERAAELLGASEELFREVGVGIEQSEAKTQERMLTSLRATLGTARTDELRARGAARPVEELVPA